mgnify:FL=1
MFVDQIDMEDPTGGMWIYLLFLAFPLARIVPRILRKYRKNTGNEEKKPKEGMKWMSESKSFFAKKPEKEPFFRQESGKKDGWFTKDDFK